MSLDAVLELQADLEGVRAIGPWLATCLESTGSAPLIEQAGAIELALHEVAVNVVEHSLNTDGSMFELRFSWSPDAAIATFATVDHGPAVQVDRLPGVPETPQIGGYGLMIVEQVADTFDYRRIDARINEWTLTFSAGDPQSE